MPVKRQLNSVPSWRVTPSSRPPASCSTTPTRQTEVPLGFLILILLTRNALVLPALCILTYLLSVGSENVTLGFAGSTVKGHYTVYSQVFQPLPGALQAYPVYFAIARRRQIWYYDR